MPNQKICDAQKKVPGPILTPRKRYAYIDFPVFGDKTTRKCIICDSKHIWRATGSYTARKVAIFTIYALESKKFALRKKSPGSYLDTP